MPTSSTIFLRTVFPTGSSPGQHRAARARLTMTLSGQLLAVRVLEPPALEHRHAQGPEGAGAHGAVVGRVVLALPSRDEEVPACAPAHRRVTDGAHRLDTRQAPRGRAQSGGRTPPAAPRSGAAAAGGLTVKARAWSTSNPIGACCSFCRLCQRAPKLTRRARVRATWALTSECSAATRGIARSRPDPLPEGTGPGAAARAGWWGRGRRRGWSSPTPPG